MHFTCVDLNLLKEPAVKLFHNDASFDVHCCLGSANGDKRIALREVPISVT